MVALEYASYYNYYIWNWITFLREGETYFREGKGIILFPKTLLRQGLPCISFSKTNITYIKRTSKPEDYHIQHILGN